MNFLSNNITQIVCKHFFRYWLNENVHKALQKLRASQPLRNETERLCSELKDSLKLKDVLWNCGWGITHFRGCLQSFKGLLIQHPGDMKILNGKTPLIK